MSVIAKMHIQSVTDFGTGRLVELGCVADNEVMAAYNESDEDKLFTKYSPWGEMKISQPAGWALGNGKVADEFGPAPRFYVMALHKDEHELVEQPSEGHRPDPNFPGASAWVFGVCHVVSDFGGTCHVEFRGGNQGSVKGRAIEKLNWKMSVDNPGASNQFKPGHPYWIVLYDAEKFDMQAAIRAAHGHPEPTPSAAEAEEARD